MTSICFSGNSSVAFIKRDYEILKKFFEVIIIEPPKTKLEWTRYPSIVKKIVKKSDIVFGWFAGWITTPAVYYAKKYNKKSVIVVGGYDAAYVPEINYGAFTNIREKIPAKYVLMHADLLLAVSEFNKKEILKKIKPRKIKVVYNGVDVENFKPDKDKNNNLVITVGKIKKINIKRKGIKTFVGVAKYLPGIDFAVIGGVVDDSIDYLKSIASKNVKFTGFVSDQELLRWYQRAKVICQLSYYESFGLAPAEGMACECIPVVTDRGALSEIVGNIGFYVPYGDEKATADAIKRALEISDEKRKKARERIMKMFSMDIREEKLLEIIENMVRK